MSSSTSTEMDIITDTDSSSAPPCPPAGDFQVAKNDVLRSGSSHYLVEAFKGEGCFGKVAQCLNLDTKEKVAIKILKNYYHYVEDAKREVAMLKTVRILDPDRNNLVRWHECFVHKGHTCLAFEMLDKSLRDFMNERELEPLSLNEIRPIIQQLAVAFKALKRIGIIHTDLKPDNIMLVDQVKEPFKVKVIDFGSAIPVSKVKRGSTFQALSYRSPEVLLGLPISEAIDMWALGCVMAVLYIGYHLYPGDSEYDIVKLIFETQGLPEEELLNAGTYTGCFFTKDPTTFTKWRLKTPVEYRRETGIQYRGSEDKTIKQLDDVKLLYGEAKEDIERDDLSEFLSLLKRFLELNPEKRITPSEALGHRFISMTHLADNMDDSAHVQASLRAMCVCMREDSLMEEIPSVGAIASPAEGDSAIASPAEGDSPTAVPCEAASATTGPADGDEVNTVPVEGASVAVSTKGRNEKKRFKSMKISSRVARALCCCCGQAED